MPNKQMTCEEYFDTYWDTECSIWMDEMHWEDSYNSETLWDAMLKDADRHKIELTDEKTFKYDKFFYDIWRNIERGLS